MTGKEFQQTQHYTKPYMDSDVNIADLARNFI